MFDMPDTGRETCVVKYVKKLHRFYQGGSLKEGVFHDYRQLGDRLPHSYDATHSSETR